MKIHVRPKTNPFTPVIAVERVLVSRRLCLAETSTTDGRKVKIGIERLASRVWFVRLVVDRENKAITKGPRWVTLTVEGGRNIWQVHERDPRKAVSL